MHVAPADPNARYVNQALTILEFQPQHLYQIYKLLERSADRKALARRALRFSRDRLQAKMAVRKPVSVLFDTNSSARTKIPPRAWPPRPLLLDARGLLAWYAR